MRKGAPRTARSLAEIAVGLAVVHRRIAAFQEVAADGKQVSGIRNIELRHTRGAKHLLAGLSYRSLLKWLVRQPARADTLGKPFEDHAHVPVNGL